MDTIIPPECRNPEHLVKGERERARGVGWGEGERERERLAMTSIYVVLYYRRGSVSNKMFACTSVDTD